MLQYRALGGLTVADDGDDLSVGGPRQRRLVAMLLVHRNSVVSADRLSEAVFAVGTHPLVVEYGSICAIEGSVEDSSPDAGAHPGGET
jgi:hypothetical protein